MHHLSQGKNQFAIMRGLMLVAARSFARLGLVILALLQSLAGPLGLDKAVAGQGLTSAMLHLRRIVCVIAASAVVFVAMEPLRSWVGSLSLSRMLTGASSGSSTQTPDSP
jgi:hypothetical protein